MVTKVEPIFTAEFDNPHDMELLKEFFGVKAIDKAFEDGDGHREILNNAAIARQLQELEVQLPPEIREENERVQQLFEKTAAIKRQTREPEEPEALGVQMSLF